MSSSEENRTVKVVEVIGESNESWEDAAQNAVSDASATLEGISGIEVVEQTAEVEGGDIVQFRATVHVAFPIQR
jgi:flavin-binding protein dodecin